MIEYKTQAKIINCKNEICKNTATIARLSKQNVRLLDSLVSMIRELPEAQKDRYDKELASDGWKNTDYHKRKFAK